MLGIPPEAFVEPKVPLFQKVEQTEEKKENADEGAEQPADGENPEAAQNAEGKKKPDYNKNIDLGELLDWQAEQEKLEREGKTDEIDKDEKQR